MSLAEIIKTALDEVHTTARTETIVGEPIKAGDVTLIPVSKVSIGFAAGGAGNDEKKGRGAGTGGGVTVVPVAFVAVVGNKVEVHPMDKGDPVLQKLFAHAPDIMNKVMKITGKDRDGKNKKKDEGKEKEKKQ